MATTYSTSPRAQAPSLHTRDPFWAAALSGLTLTIYGFWWWYDINRELRRRGQATHPWRALSAITLGWMLVAPPFRAVRHTTAAIAALQQQAGARETARPQTAASILAVFALGLLLFFTSIWFAPGFYLFGWIPPLAGMSLVWYEQRELNRVQS